jgi:hypothetical protein
MKCPDAGYLGVISLIPTRYCALASKPKIGAGCGNAASPDLCGVERGNPLPYRDRLSLIVSRVAVDSTFFDFVDVWLQFACIDWTLAVANLRSDIITTPIG